MNIFKKFYNSLTGGCSSTSATGATFNVPPEENDPFLFPVEKYTHEKHQLINGKMHLHWIIPDFGIGSGGHFNIFRMIHWLEKFGHTNQIWIISGSKHGKPSSIKKVICNNFFEIQADVNILRNPVGLELKGDGLICSSWDTCYWGRAIKFQGIRFYFVQDFEPSFFPIGTNHFLALHTYEFGYKCITNGQWMAEKVESLGATCVGWFQQAYDPNVFFDGDERPPTSSTRFAVYVRSATERRLTGLIMYALKILHRKGIPIEVELFGDNHLPYTLDFPCSNWGVLSPEELGKIYRTCDIGCALSATNYSLIPFEMMASGLPVVEFDGENTRSTYPENGVMYAKPTPEGIADAFQTLIDNPELRQKIRSTGMEYVKSISWEKSARSVERAFLQEISA